MTASEAKLFLQHKDADNLEDAYDHTLFEYKQFFLTKPLVPKIFFAKIEKLQKAIAAAEVLEINKGNSSHLFEWNITQTEIFREWVSHFETRKNQWKKELSACKNLIAVSESVKQFLAHFETFTSKWPDFPFIEADIKISAEPDPMWLLEEIQRLNAIGIVTFTDLLNDGSTLTVELKKESIRLNRLSQMF